MVLPLEAALAVVLAVGAEAGANVVQVGGGLAAVVDAGGGRALPFDLKPVVVLWDQATLHPDRDDVRPNSGAQAVDQESLTLLEGALRSNQDGAQGGTTGLGWAGGKLPGHAEVQADLAEKDVAELAEVLARAVARPRNEVFTHPEARDGAAGVAEAFHGDLAVVLAVDRVRGLAEEVGALRVAAFDGEGDVGRNLNGHLLKANRIANVSKVIDGRGERRDVAELVALAGFADVNQLLGRDVLEAGGRVDAVAHEVAVEDGAQLRIDHHAVDDVLAAFPGGRVAGLVNRGAGVTDAVGQDELQGRVAGGLGSGAEEDLAVAVNGDGGDALHFPPGVAALQVGHAGPLLKESLSGQVPRFVARAGLRSDAAADRVAGFLVDEAAEKGGVVVEPAAQFHQALAVGATDVDV